MMNKLKHGLILVAYWLTVLLNTSAAQEPKVSIEPRPSSRNAKKEKAPDIRVDSTLVAVNVTVVDPLGRLVAGLGKKNFKVFEDGVEQEIINVSVEEMPVSVGLIFDNSGSIGEKLKKSREVVSKFLKMANPEDEFFLIQFNDQPELSVDFTKQIGNVQNRLVFTKSKGRTALLDAIMMGMANMKKAANSRKALLVVSDGGDNNSRYTNSEVKSIIEESDTQIYAIGVFEPFANRSRSREELFGEELLKNLAEKTGGREFSAENSNQLSDIIYKIGIDLRNQYMIYFNPKNKTRDGKYRRIKVKVSVPPTWPPLRAYFRSGYYAPQ